MSKKPVYQIKEMRVKIPYVSIDLPYNRTVFGQLARLGQKSELEPNLYRWQFPFPHLGEVQALLGAEMKFDLDQVHYINRHCPEIHAALPSRS